MILENKVAIITGSASGIGRATALRFSKEGAKVVVVDVIDSMGEKTAGDIRSMGGDALFIHADVSNSADVKRAVSETICKYKKIDILFNNAGISVDNATVENLDEQVWDKVIDVNLKGIFLCSKYTIPEMRRRGGGVIINMGSIDGLQGEAKFPAYCASKAAVVNLTKGMAIDFASDKIRVNCVCPGPIETKRQTPPSLIPPLGRGGKPEEVANVALFLASDESSYMTGSVVVVDGGFTSGYTTFISHSRFFE